MKRTFKFITLLSLLTGSLAVRIASAATFLEETHQPSR